MYEAGRVLGTTTPPNSAWGPSSSSSLMPPGLDCRCLCLSANAIEAFHRENVQVKKNLVAMSRVFPRADAAMVGSSRRSLDDVPEKGEGFQNAELRPAHSRD